MKIRAFLALAASLCAITAFAGNGAPSGPHFNLNIIGKDNCNGPQHLSGGNVIQIPLWGPSKILLAQGDFAVLDANGCDGTASFQLPAQSCDAFVNDGIPCEDDNPAAEVYYVYARSLGKPGGGIKITTCATDPVTGDQVCSTESMLSVRTKGKQSFTNVTKELTSICWDQDGDGTCDVRIALFDDSLEDYFWSVDNQGNRLLQLRFYRAQDINR
jgi:hypothetical protein